MTMEFFGSYSEENEILKNDKFQSDYYMTIEFFNKNSSFKSRKIDDLGILISYHC